MLISSRILRQWVNVPDSHWVFPVVVEFIRALRALVGTGNLQPDDFTIFRNSMRGHTILHIHSILGEDYTEKVRSYAQTLLDYNIAAIIQHHDKLLQDAGGLNSGKNLKQRGGNCHKQRAWL